MPYIKQEKRPILDVKVQELFGYISTEGDLNYAITKLLLQANPKSYTDYNTLIGVLECVKLEFYRRAVAAYEDEKIQENGDVY